MIERIGERMNTIWMIRNDGKAFPCSQYLYANALNMEETLLAAEWLYANTCHKESRQLALEMVAAWMASASVDGDAVSDAPGSLLQKPGCPLSQEFVKAHTEEVMAIRTENLDLNALCSEVVAELNQEFLRARYCGMEHTGASSKEMFFRISSVGFDWYNRIHDFVTAANFPIEFINIVRGEESAGAKSGLHLRLPTETFLAEQPIQLIPPSKLKGGVMVREIFAHLSFGSSLRHILGDLTIDARSLANALTVIADWENQQGIESK
ncbi:hypothetical protein [Caproiciproducens galactitolivorans]|uniref:Uncharacterized protein n=1 Tax=Caproiciproducens galactitolivorans TaxID=642589 RepID=A0ABT4BVF1_9FIRM|nr:hypothetical protein [Caproiciproducens galactitolivorans]MCY1714873.1 hypothetical protein [Caproiciproducens galactitolivorans]